MIGYGIKDADRGAEVSCLYCGQGEFADDYDGRHLKFAGWLPVAKRDWPRRGQLAWVCPQCRSRWERDMRPPPPAPSWQSERAEEMRAMRDRGMTYEAIACEYALTRERVRQILMKHGLFVSSRARQ